MSDEETLAAFRLFLEGAGPVGERVRDRGKVLAALDALDPEYAEKLSEEWAKRDRMRYPLDRPRWLGEWQPWPCGRCGKQVDNAEPHECEAQAGNPTP